MKKLILAITLFFCASTCMNLQAQHDVKLNFLGILFGQYGLQYENVLSESMTVGGGINYYQYTSGSTLLDNEATYTGFNMTPEFRFYFSPDDDAEGVFAGPYLKYRNTKAKDTFGYFNDENEYVAGDRKVTGLALGIGGGRKWVADAGFIIETYVGVGKYLVKNASYDNPDAEEAWTIDGEDVSELFNIDFRIGLGIGWRF